MLPVLAAGLLLFAGPRPGSACTIIAGGKGSTVDGSAFVVHTDDAGGRAADIRLVRVPAADHDEGAMRPVYAFDNGNPRVVTHSRGPYYKPLKGQQLSEPLGYIPQVSHTHGYYDHDYGLANDAGLAMAESTVPSRTLGWSVANPYGHCLFDIAELSKIGLERCATARCAIQTMGDLASRYGFATNYTGTPWRPWTSDSGETLAIADRSGEAWIFHVLTGDYNRGAIWVAQRIPDGHIAAVPNTLVIRRIDFADPENFMWSENVQEVAVRNGWWNPDTDGPFDFARAYIDNNPIPLIPVYTGRRAWRIYDLVAPSIKMDPYLGYLPLPDRPTYPFSVPPDQKVTARQLMAITMDYYEGTEFDQTKGLAAGPYGNPVRFAGYSGWNSSTTFPGSWERTISIYRCVYTIVTFVRPNMEAGAAALMWFGQDAPHGTVFVPFYGGQDSIPPSFLKGKQSEFSLDSAFWAFNFVNNWSYQMWRLIHAEVVKEQKRLQDRAFELVAEEDKAACRAPHHGKWLKAVEKRQTEFAEFVVAEWWKLAFRLIAKYNNGYTCTSEAPGHQKSWGYPIWYLKEVGYTSWPGAHYSPLGPNQHPLPLGYSAPTPPRKSRKDVVPAAPITEATTMEATARPAAPVAQGPGALRRVSMFALGSLGAVGYLKWTGTARSGYHPLP